MRPRPTPSTRKILFAVYGTLVLLCAVIIAFLHVSELRDHRAQALDRAAAATGALAAQVNADHLERLLHRYDGRGMIFKNTQDAWYYVMHDQLRRATERLGTKEPIRIVAYDSLKHELQVLVTASSTPMWRTTVDAQLGSLVEHYESPARHNVKDHGRLLTLDPIVNENGKLLGAVMAEVPLSSVDALAHASLMRQALIALLLFTLAGLVLFRSVGRWLKNGEAAHEALAQSHASIADSILYAGKIQRALVPAPEVYNALFTDAFVIDRPKNTVSGDFHWVHRLDDDVSVVAAADCTGHGLPGAMLAAIACSLLNEIVLSNPQLDPASILTLLNTRLVTTLHQQGRSRGAGDGLDIALCKINREKQEILFAGAMRPLYWVHQGKLSVINGDRRPVGGAHHDLDRRFTTHRLAYAPGDRLYLFSDGYVDQSGGPDNKRFMSARLQQLIHAHQGLGMKEQGHLLEEAFLDWQGRNEQVDDVCLIGLAV